MSAVYRGFGSRPREAFALEGGIFQREKMPEFAQAIFAGIEAASHEPFKGITTDGDFVPGLYELVETGISTAPIAEAGQTFVSSLTSEQYAQALHEVDGDEARRWTNAFPMWEPHGLLLDDLESAQRELALAVVAASMSARGFAETRRLMLFNDILADLIGDTGRDSLGEWKYRLALFGQPSSTQPWGWQLWGHHLNVSCFMIGGQVVMTPTFMGAEPATIDEGPHAGLTAFERDRLVGLEVLQGLTEAQAFRAVLYPSMLTSDLPPELTHPTEGRHRGGNGADNVIQPYEGVRASNFSEVQRRALMELVDCYIGRMGDGWAQQRLQEVERHLDSTYFAWIGSPDGDGPFYYKVHSPVIMIEYDNHTGIFIDNPEPEPFHVHTIVRTPNGNDYGRDLLRQHYAGSHGGAHHHPAGRRSDLHRDRPV